MQPPSEFSDKEQHVPLKKLFAIKSEHESGSSYVHIESKHVFAFPRMRSENPVKENKEDLITVIPFQLKNTGRKQRYEIQHIYFITAFSSRLLHNLQHESSERKADYMSANLVTIIYIHVCLFNYITEKVKFGVRIVYTTSYEYYEHIIPTYRTVTVHGAVLIQVRTVYESTRLRLSRPECHVALLTVSTHGF